MSTSQFDPPPEPKPPPTGAPDRRALLAAYQDVLREVKTQPKSRRRLPVPSRAPFWIAVVAAIVGLSSLLVFQPAWLFNQPPTESPQEQEASLRIRMYVEIDRIARFKDTHKKLPESLSEAGADGSGLVYEHHGDSFALSGRNASLALTYRSGESPDAFLGSSYDVVRARFGKGRK